jgi:SAM-dependent methyltransferase
VGWAVRRARELADPIAVRRAGASSSEVPPRRLRARTGAPGIRAFVEGGATAASELAAAFERAGRGPLAGAVSSVLDLGCGSARVLPHIAALTPGAAHAGCDVDGAAISWASEHHPAIRWERSGFHPPLPFEDRSFELVYSISVFSHLGSELQDAWLAEVARVLAPGGVALLSVHGPHAFEQFRTGAVATGWCPRSAFARGPLEESEFMFVPYRRSVWNEGELPGVEGDYGLAFHGPSYLRRHWGAVLQVVDLVERGLTAWQDLVVFAAHDSEYLGSP